MKDADASAGNSKPSIVDALQTLDWRSLSIGKIIEMPNAAYSYGIGLGVATVVGMARFAFTRNLRKAVHYSIITFCASSAVTFELSRFQRREAIKQLTALTPPKEAADRN